MKTVSLKLYQYSELSDKAKEKARDWWVSGGFDFAWDNVKEDANQAGIILEGIGRGGNMDGKFKEYAEKSAKYILANHGKACETFKTAKEYLDGLKEAGDDDEKREELTEEFKRSILEDYRISYENDQEYQSSEEAIAEAMEANEYDFTEAGKRF
jgi:hypothetical protein